MWTLQILYAVLKISFAETETLSGANYNATKPYLWHHAAMTQNEALV